MKPNKTYGTQWPRIEATAEFITKHSLVIRPAGQVSIRLEKIGKEDAFGFASEVLIQFVTLDGAVPVLNEEAKAKYKAAPELWKVTDTEEAVQDFLDYMMFAWGKAMDERGLSAARSISKLSAWLWVLGREDLSDLLERGDLYNPYGAPALIAVCEKLDITVPKELRTFAAKKA